MSASFDLAKKYLGKKVEVIIDRPLGSKHPEHDLIYGANYGYVAGTAAPDGEELDAYYLGDVPVEKAAGICVAIIHRLNDDDDKLVVTPAGEKFSREEIAAKVAFQEKYFQSEIIMA